MLEMHTIIMLLRWFKSATMIWIMNTGRLGHDMDNILVTYYSDKNMDFILYPVVGV